MPIGSNGRLDDERGDRVLMLRLPDAADPIAEARRELLREAQDLLARWDGDRRDRLVQGRLLQSLEILRLLVTLDGVQP